MADRLNENRKYTGPGGFETERLHLMLADAVEALREGFALFDENLTFVHSNGRYRDLALSSDAVPPRSGDCFKDIARLSFPAFAVPEGSNVEEFVQQSVEMISGTRTDIEQVRRDGRVVLVSAKKTGLGAYLIIYRDVTDQKRVEDAEEVFIDAIERLPVGVAVEDRHGNISHCNAAFASFYGVPAATLKALGFNDRMELIYVKVSLLNGVAIGQDPPERHLNKGSWRRASLETIEVQLKDGRSYLLERAKTKDDGRVVVMTDITELKAAEKRALSVVNDAIETLDLGLALYDADFRFVLGNRFFFELFFKEVEPIRPGEHFLAAMDRFHEVNFFKIPDGMTTDEYGCGLVELSKRFAKHVLVELTDGRTMLASSNKTELGGFLLEFTDITERRDAEQLFAEAIQQLPVGLSIEDSEGTVTHCNPAYASFFGMKSETLVGMPMARRMERFHQIVESADGRALPADLDQMNAFVSEMRARPFGALDIKRRDGRFFQLERTGMFGGRRGIVLTDITALKEAEQKSLEAVTDAIQATEDMLVLFDQDLNFVLANDKWTETHSNDRRRPEPGDGFSELFSGLVADDFYVLPANVGQDQFVDFIKDAVLRYTKGVTYLLKDGRTFISGSFETRLGGYLVSSKDITDQLTAEREIVRQREIAHQNEKLSALGELLAGVAHELNNPLSVVFGYAQMLQGKVSDPKVAERLELIRQSAERSAKIVKTFLAMARQRPARVELCSLNEAARTAIEVSSYSLTTNGTEVRIELDDTLPPVMGDLDQLAQVFANLIVNAGHALQAQREKGSLCLRSFHDRETDMCVVEVRDNGPGIPEEIQGRIFEPFFTTKEVGEGTGVGLAFSHRIIGSHGGELSLKSASGDGTSFFVKLPSAIDSADLMPDPTTERTPTGTKSVLVVDDETGVLRLTRDLLADEGFSVTQSDNPRDALNILETHTFDAVLSDFKMPDMDGEHFYDALKIIAPECAERTGFITGDAMNPAATAFFDRSQRPHIEKPIMRDELVDLGKRLCDGEDAWRRVQSQQ